MRNYRKYLEYLGLTFSIFLLTAALNSEGRAQEVFEDPEGKYVITLPTGWLGIINQDALGRTDVNIVYKVRENGSLKIRRVENPDPTVDVIEYANKDEADRVRFSPGYTKIRMEKFLISAGKYGGLLSYDYQTVSNQPFTGRVYYVRTEDQTVYILHFTGRKSILGSLRNQTDSIARSFKSK